MTAPTRREIRQSGAISAATLVLRGRTRMQAAQRAFHRADTPEAKQAAAEDGALGRKQVDAGGRLLVKWGLAKDNDLAIHDAAMAIDGRDPQGNLWTAPEGATLPAIDDLDLYAVEQEFSLYRW